MNGKCKDNKEIISSAEDSVKSALYYLCFSQQRVLGTPITGPILCEKPSKTCT